MGSVIQGSLMSLGAFVVLFVGFLVAASSLGILLAPADVRMLGVVMAIAALFIGFNT